MVAAATADVERFNASRLLRFIEVEPRAEEDGFWFFFDDKVLSYFCFFNNALRCQNIGIIKFSLRITKVFYFDETNIY